MQLSVIVPVYNEKDNIIPLVVALHNALQGIDYEIIMVDDGSTDGTSEAILTLHDHTIHLVSFHRNYGQTSAIAAGIEAACGQYIATIDGDLQNDPSDIPLMLARLQEGKYDMISGRRVNRQDTLFFKKIPSFLANALIRSLTGVQISDYGCTLKVFKTSFAKRLELYGELHRFIPILSTLQGARVDEMDVKHHPRKHGVSKYGLERILKVISDLLLMLFFKKYHQKPMHLFGTLGIVMFLAGMSIESYLLVLKIAGEHIGNRPLFYIGIMLIITSVQLITTGFLAELMMRTYYSAQNKKPYSIMQSRKVAKEESIKE